MKGRKWGLILGAGLSLVLALALSGCGGADDGQGLELTGQDYVLAKSDASAGVQTRISKTMRPADEAHSTTAKFGFSCSADACTYKCALDSAGWKACASPKVYKNLKGGGHIFQVKAKDSAGNVDKTPAVHAWNISDVWLATDAKNAPSARTQHRAVWADGQMVVWGGLENYGGYEANTGGVYDPATDSWTAIPTANAPAGRHQFGMVWTGSEAIIWAGVPYSKVPSGGGYNLSTNSWSAMSTTNCPAGQSYFSALWDGTDMIVWGGMTMSSGMTNTGGKYNPTSNSWTATSTTNAPTMRSDASAVWDDDDDVMIIWGGFDGTNYLADGAKYNASGNVWTAIATGNAPDARRYHAAVWTGTDMIVWGGYNGTAVLNTGAKYNVAGDAWTAISATNAPAARKYASAVWTGTEMIVWGGMDGTPASLKSGGKYDPALDRWVPTSLSKAPSARSSHSAVWDDGEGIMIIWGEADDRSGGRYWP